MLKLFVGLRVIAWIVTGFVVIGVMADTPVHGLIVTQNTVFTSNLPEGLIIGDPTNPANNPIVEIATGAVINGPITVINNSQFTMNGGSVYGMVAANGLGGANASQSMPVITVNDGYIDGRLSAENGGLIHFLGGTKANCGQDCKNQSTGGTLINSGGIVRRVDTFGTGVAIITGGTVSERAMVAHNSTIIFIGEGFQQSFDGGVTWGSRFDVNNDGFLSAVSSTIGGEFFLDAFYAPGPLDLPVLHISKNDPVFGKCDSNNATWPTCAAFPDPKDDPNIWFRVWLRDNEGCEPVVIPSTFIDSGNAIGQGSSIILEYAPSNQGLGCNLVQEPQPQPQPAPQPEPSPAGPGGVPEPYDLHTDWSHDWGNHDATATMIQSEKKLFILS